MLSASKRTARLSRDDGFTLIELTIVLLVMSIVLAIAGSVLFSLSTTANRNESMVADEQAASNAIAQITRDIRSATSISFPLGTPASQIQLVDNLQSGGTQTVTWAYDSTAQTLTRQVQVGGSFRTSGTPVSRVSNNMVPVFAYFDVNGNPISSSTISNIVQCTTLITVNIYVASSTTGVSPFQETDQAALTNQLNTLSAPGSNGQCTSTS
jgi:prepilin-type N-terminal cleavage/methylation domain-containing protein